MFAFEADLPEPMDMKSLKKNLVSGCDTKIKVQAMYTYPKVAAEPIMYCPILRMIPLGPGPCWKTAIPPN